MTARILPPEEWPKLRGTELETVWPHLDREKAYVLVIEDGEQIVGTWAFFPVLIAEGVWIDPTHRGKGAVARHLLKAMRHIVPFLESQTVVTSAQTPEVATMLEALGAVDLSSRVFSLKVGPSCPPQ